MVHTHYVPTVAIGRVSRRSRMPIGNHTCARSGLTTTGNRKGSDGGRSTLHPSPVFIGNGSGLRLSMKREGVRLFVCCSLSDKLCCSSCYRPHSDAERVTDQWYIFSACELLKTYTKAHLQHVNDWPVAYPACPKLPTAISRSVDFLAPVLNLLNRITVFWCASLKIACASVCIWRVNVSCLHCCL